MIIGGRIKACPFYISRVCCALLTLVDAVSAGVIPTDLNSAMDMGACG